MQVISGYLLKSVEIMFSCSAIKEHNPRLEATMCWQTVASSIISIEVSLCMLPSLNFNLLFFLLSSLLELVGFTQKDCKTPTALHRPCVRH